MFLDLLFSEDYPENLREAPVDPDFTKLCAELGLNLIVSDISVYGSTDPAVLTYRAELISSLLGDEKLRD